MTTQKSLPLHSQPHKDKEAKLLDECRMTDQELEKHISSCADLMASAYARYELSGSFKDRGEALGWLQAETLAISCRSASQRALMHAEIDRCIDEGVGFFAAAGARDALAVRQGVAA